MLLLLSVPLVLARGQAPPWPDPMAAPGLQAFDPYAPQLTAPAWPLGGSAAPSYSMDAPGPLTAISLPPMHADPMDVVCAPYVWQWLPGETLYPTYLADVKAPRLAGQWVGGSGDESLLDGSVGGRFGLLRYVQASPSPWKRGFQLDVEGAGLLRLDRNQELDFRSADFRAGVPLSFSFGQLQTRFGYYHLSSHLGDEFLLKNPGFPRVNYSRDVLFAGAAYWLSPRSRVYGEAGWAFYSDVSKEWEFLFGYENAPRQATGVRGAPFFAAHAHLREELDFGGHATVQGGWAWRSAHDSGLLRLGLHYFNGKSAQFSFYDTHEQLLGLGLWYDF